MSFNIVDLVKDQITDAVLEKAGGLLGGDAANLSSGMSSAIPALLGGLTGSANAPGKAGGLFEAVNNTDDSLLNDFAGALGSSNSSSMIEQGSSTLTGLMGSGMMDNLGSVLSAVSGMSRNGSGSLMGMLAPVILGVLKKKVMGGGMNASGLLSMLNDQKSNVARAMPANLSSQLSNINGFPSFDGLPSASSIASGVSGVASNVAGGVSGAASNVAGGVSSGAGAVGDAAKSTGGGIGKWLVPILAALGLGWLAFTFLGKGDVDAPDVSGAASDAASAAGDAATDAAGAATDAASAAAGDLGVDGLTGNVTGMFNSASETLGGITDIESATAAVPALEELGGSVAGLPDLFDKVPEAARGPLQGIVGEGMGSLQPIIDKVMAIPGVGGVVGPILEPILETLGGLAG